MHCFITCPAFTAVQHSSVCVCVYVCRQFADWCMNYGKHGCRTPDTPFSLFEGNMSHPQKSWFSSLVLKIVHFVCIYRYGRYHLLPGRPPAASEGEVPSVWGVKPSSGQKSSFWNQRVAAPPRCSEKKKTCFFPFLFCHCVTKLHESQRWEVLLSLSFDLLLILCPQKWQKTHFQTVTASNCMMEEVSVALNCSD